MMTEQQTALKSDEMQEKWKKCVVTTCYAYRVAERVREVIDTLYDVMRQVINSLAEAFKPVMETISFTFETLKDYIDEEFELTEYDKSYPQSYPRHVDNFRVNTKGFPRPITRCARSRC